MKSFLKALGFLLGLVSLIAPPASAIPTRNMTVRAHWDEYPAYAACWAYVHPDGREYAVIGAQGGTAIYNITNPNATYRVGYIPGPSSLWREMKSYRTWIYVVTEATAPPDPGLQIISMANPEAPVLSGTYNTNFTRSHTVSVDTTRAILICNGTNSGSGATGMRFLSLANPASPVEIGWWPGGSLPVATTYYVHDSVPIGNRLYASSIYVGVERILNWTNPAAVTQIHSWTYPGGFTHNSWPSASGTRLYVTDETRQEPLKIFDITTPTSPTLLGTFTPNFDGIVHNAHVKGNELYLANYSDGVRILDLSDPAHPAEFAWADTYPGLSGSFNGVWEFCPFFPSGRAIASDMSDGLYVFDITRDYGLVTVSVTEQGPNTPLSAIDVFLLEEGDVRYTDADGVLRLAPSPGTHTLEVRAFGFQTFTTSLNVVDDGSQTIPVSLLRLPTVSFGGVVRSYPEGDPLNDAEVDFVDAPLHAHTSPTGLYGLSGVPEGTYVLWARRPGYAPATITRPITASSSEQWFGLRVAPSYDDVETGAGWTVGAAGDNATTGQWVRVEPLGTGMRYQELSPASADPIFPRRGRLEPLHEGHETDTAIPGDVQPETDRTPGAGQYCFVTGQGVNPGGIGEADVDNGITTLTSRIFNATGLSEPTFGYWRWLYAAGLEDDYLAVLISNNGGASWVSVDTTRGLHPHWEEATIRVADYLPATSQMQLRFVAADLNTYGGATVVEAAIDDVILYDASMPVVGAPGPARPLGLVLQLASANPARADVSFHVEAPVAGTELSLQIVDVRGRLVRTVHHGPAAEGPVTLIWDGRDAAGRPAASGFYLAVARAGDERATTRFLRLR